MERLKINGPPGCGKTTYLVEKAGNLINNGISPSEIIYTTFTKAAASEAIGRILGIFPNYKKTDFIYWRTEHSICFRLLGLKKEQVFSRRHLIEFGKRYRYDFSGEDGDNLESRYQEAMLQSLADHFEFFVGYMENRMLAFDGAYKDFLKSNVVPDGFSKSALGHYIDRRTQYKFDQKLWSFSDMITGVLQQGLSPGEAKVLILDEAQDCSPHLWELIKFWSTKVDDYYIAGDPLQTLYFWAGSDPQLFFDFPGEEQTLDQTHRFGREIKDYAERVVSPTGLPIPPFRPADKPSSVSRKSFHSIDWQNVGDAFLLVRTRWLISQVVDQFIATGVPFVSERGRQSPLATTKGRAYHTLVRLAEGHSATDSELKNLVKFTGPPYLERGAKTRVRKLEEGAYQKWQLKEMGFSERFMDALYGGFDDVLCQKIEDWEKAYLGRVYRKHGLEVFEHEPKLTITTIHGSKGRECSNVYVMPDMTATVWDAFLRSKIPETLLYYVACTRAKDNLTLLLPQRDHSYPLPRLNNGGKI